MVRGASLYDRFNAYERGTVPDTKLWRADYPNFIHPVLFAMEQKSVVARVAIDAIYAAYGQNVSYKSIIGILSKEREEVGNYRFIQFIGRAKQVRLILMIHHLIGPDL